MGDVVLERNLIFVDTPGYSNGLSKTETIEAVSQYIGSQLRKSFAPPSESESDILGLLSGNGGSQVDLVLYLMTESEKQFHLLYFVHDGSPFRRGQTGRLDIPTAARAINQCRSFDSKIRYTFS